MQKSAKSQKANTHRYREVFPSIRKNAPITQTPKKKYPMLLPPRSRRYNNSSVQYPSREKTLFTHSVRKPSKHRHQLPDPTNHVVPPPLMKYTQRRVWSTSEKNFLGEDDFTARNMRRRCRRTHTPTMNHSSTPSTVMSGRP
jgi:hypothetical protein